MYNLDFFKEMFIRTFVAMLFGAFVVWGNFKASEPIKSKVLIKALKKIFPKLNWASHDRRVKLIKNEKYKRHKRKWIKRYFLSQICVYMISYIILATLTDGGFAGYISTLISLVYVAVIGNKEGEERQAVEDDIVRSSNYKL